MRKTRNVINSKQEPRKKLMISIKTAQKTIIMQEVGHVKFIILVTVERLEAVGIFKSQDEYIFHPWRKPGTQKNKKPRVSLLV